MKIEKVLLLDLSGDLESAQMWVGRLFPGARTELVSKSELKRGSKLESLRRVRRLEPDALAIFTADLKSQSGRRALFLFGAVAGARLIVMGDSSGRTLSSSRLGALMLAPALALELAAGYLIIVPLSFLLTLVLDLALPLSELSGRRRHPGGLRNCLYVRATISSSGREGGMATHTAGFASGAMELGHRLKFIAASAAGIDQNVFQAEIIRPSAAINTTRALFELWNNLLFTAKAIGCIFRGSWPDFIYQRYSRFNWTGVVLKLISRAPLVLEFNGSEVWLSRHWDPVGLIWLLERFERLNLKVADLIVVVSAAERESLLARGIQAGKILINPNGARADLFRPGCGGNQIRKELGIEDKIVVGFLGTFGPWHGAEVLAEAAALIQMPDCHFLFIGDGDARAATEAIIRAAGKEDLATFVGRIPHERVPAYLDACDILVSPHLPLAGGREFFGSPTKLFEYMAAGRAVIASRIGQMAEIIRDGENGLLVEPADARALSRAIELLAYDKDLRARLGQAARQTVCQRYTWLHNARRVFSALEQLV
jgi:glycosyltransferase involved in cell wall biosynthesis